jgi:hypothetical protein
MLDTRLPSISRAALCWLQHVIGERISSELQLKTDPVYTSWQLVLPGSTKEISIPILPNFYLLGPQADLPCALLDLAEENFIGLERHLEAPALGELSLPLVRHTIAGFHIGYDILGLTYWMLARCEEVAPPALLLDKHQRFPATSSHAFHHGYLERPIVDEWLGILRQVISRLWPRLPLIQPQFEVIVSHDVDAPSAYAFGRKRSLARAMAGDFLVRRNLINAVSAPWIRLKTKYKLHHRDSFNTFDWLMDTSEASGMRSAFYFICGRTAPHVDAQYEPEHPAIRDLMRRIHQRGHEIGLHPSYNTCSHPEIIVSEGQRLQRICAEEGIEQPHWGGRMHYLRWQWPTTAYGWEKAGFSYDSTLSYADRPGFRCGTCHPYSMFDPVAQRPLRLIQRPLIAMECSVISSVYLGLGYGNEALDLFKLLKNRCRAVAGQFTLLWHNNSLASDVDRQLYLKVLAL